MFNGIMIIIGIIVAIVTQKFITKKMSEKQEFSGIGWGLLNGVVGTGFLWIIIVYVEIRKAIKKFEKDKKYQKYCRKEMRNFAITYGVCLAVWIFIGVLGSGLL